jgi:FAD/FMN-containing dehydrogenase
MPPFTAITIDHASAVTDDETIATLQARVAGKVSFPGEPGYKLSVPWNVAVPMMPRAAIAVSGAEDVAEVVRFAAAHRLRVVVQRTGHGAVPTDGNDILLIHTGRLGRLEIDPQARVARIGAGLVWQDVIDAAAAHGLAPLAGSAPGVWLRCERSPPPSSIRSARCRMRRSERSTPTPSSTRLMSIGSCLTTA